MTIVISPAALWFVAGTLFGIAATVGACVVLYRVGRKTRAATSVRR